MVDCSSSGRLRFSAASLCRKGHSECFYNFGGHWWRFERISCPSLSPGSPQSLSWERHLCPGKGPCAPRQLALRSPPGAAPAPLQLPMQTSSALTGPFTPCFFLLVTFVFLSVFVDHFFIILIIYVLLSWVCCFLSLTSILFIYFVSQLYWGIIHK